MLPARKNRASNGRVGAGDSSIAQHLPSRVCSHPNPCGPAAPAPSNAFTSNHKAAQDALRRPLASPKPLLTAARLVGEVKQDPHDRGAQQPRDAGRQQVADGLRGGRAEHIRGTFPPGRSARGRASRRPAGPTGVRSAMPPNPSAKLCSGAASGRSHRNPQFCVEARPRATAASKARPGSSRPPRRHSSWRRS